MSKVFQAQQPGIETSRVNSKSIGYKEWAIIQRLGRVWFVSEANRKEYQGRNYKFIILKPTQKISENFHLERSILCVLVDETSFPESDFLVFSEWMVSYFLKDKVDKLCVMVICRDKKIVEKIQKIVHQNSESKIFIPFTFDECSSNAVDDEHQFMTDRLKKFFYQRNLFDHRSPLCNDTYFFGRDEVVQNLYDRYKSGENSGLFGLRKIGKTSVLYALQRRLKLRKEPVLFMDFESLHKKRWNNLLRQIILKIYKEYSISENEVILLAHSEYPEEDAQEFFECDIKAIFDYLQNGRMLLIFDEIEHITFGTSSSPHWKEGNDFLDFWQAIRATFQNNRDIFSFVITGTNPKSVETTFLPGDYENPIRILIPSEYLGGFSESNVREMVSYIGNYMGLYFEESLFERLSSDYGGNPFLIRQACSALHQLTTSDRPFQLTLQYYLDNKNNINKELFESVDLILETLEKRYEDEYELLKHLANGDYETFSYYVELSRRYIEHVEKYGLVEEVSGKYRFRIPVVRDRLREISNSDLVIRYEPDTSVTSLISSGESETLEFKSTLCWNIDENRKDKNLELEVVKAICAFMNTKGGTVLIGIGDDQSINGLNHDYRALKSESHDLYSRHLSNNVLINSIDGDLVCLCKITFPKIQGKNICRVDVEPSPRAVFMKYRKDKNKPFEEYFFIRNGASSKSLEKQDLLNYYSSRWP